MWNIKRILSEISDSGPNLNVIREFLGRLTYSHILLAISHTDYRTSVGGVEKFIQAEQIFCNQNGLSYVQISPTFDYRLGAKNNQVIRVNLDGNNVGFMTLVQLGALLNYIKSENQVKTIGIHLHHLMGFSLQAVKHFIDEVNSDLIHVYIHDYFMICPQNNLLLNNREYCGISIADSYVCKKCKWEVKRKNRAQAIKDLLESNKITSFVAPSNSVKEIWVNNYPELAQKLTVTSLELYSFNEYQPSPKGGNSKIRIAYVGIDSHTKGWDIWRELINRVDHNSYELFYFGTSEQKIKNLTMIPVSIVTDGPNAMIEQLKKYKIDIAFLWSICPETYSFTLFESLKAGCFIITNNLSGNIAAKVEELKQGLVFTSKQEMFVFFERPDEGREIISQTRKIGIYTEFNSKMVEEVLAKLKQKIDTKNYLNEVELTNILVNQSDLVYKTTNKFTVKLRISIKNILKKMVKGKLKEMLKLIFNT